MSKLLASRNQGSEVIDSRFGTSLRPQVPWFDIRLRAPVSKFGTSSLFIRQAPAFLSKASFVCMPYSLAMSSTSVTMKYWPINASSLGSKWRSTIVLHKIIGATQVNTLLQSFWCVFGQHMLIRLSMCACNSEVCCFDVAVYCSIVGVSLVVNVYMNVQDKCIICTWIQLQYNYMTSIFSKRSTSIFDCFKSPSFKFVNVCCIKFSDSRLPQDAPAHGMIFATLLVWKRFQPQKPIIEYIKRLQMIDD